MAKAYYSEIDPYAAEWLRNLIAAGHIAPGDVDTRDIRDVRPDDLRGYRQCHFFAGIGVWSHALRLAGWPDDREVWTGSCPCQPFSAAGRGDGFADERHLWPAWHWLIGQCRPAVVFGEQVASSAADPWLDLVQADLEALGYAVGAEPIPAAGIGAPHIRDRLWWVGHASPRGRREQRDAVGSRQGGHADGAGDASGRLADGGGTGLERRDEGAVGRQRPAAERGGRAGGVADDLRDGPQGREPAVPTAGGRRSAHADGEGTGRVADADGAGPRAGQRHDTTARHGDPATAARGDDRHVAAGPLHGFWRDADWLLCRDGKWRPVEPGTFPLAHGAAARVGRLRAYGNAIVGPLAAEFIAAFLDAEAARARIAVAAADLL